MPDPAPAVDTGRAFRFQRDARSGVILLALTGWLGALLALRAFFAAEVWIVALLALPVLPALWELWRAPAAWLEIDARELRWHSARSTAEIALSEIDHVMLVTRWDLSIRATVHCRIGTHHRIPVEVTPKANALKPALNSRGITVKTQHFNVL